MRLKEYFHIMKANNMCVFVCEVGQVKDISKAFSKEVIIYLGPNSDMSKEARIAATVFHAEGNVCINALRQDRAW